MKAVFKHGETKTQPMGQTRRRRKTPGRFGFLVSLTCFAAAGCQTVAPPPLPPVKRNVTVDDQANADTHAAERLKLQAKFREGLALYSAGRLEEGLAILSGVLTQCAEEGIALPPAMNAQLRAVLAQAPAAPAPQPPTRPKPVARTVPASSARVVPPEKTPAKGSPKPAPDITEVRLPALTDPAMADQLIPMDFNQADLRIVIKAISELTGLNFLLDENVKGTVTLISPTKVRRGDVYKVLQSILETKGFATSPSGSLIKIMPRADVNKRNLPYGIGNDPAAVPQNDTLVTWIIPLAYAGAADLSGIISPLLGGTVAVYAQTNSLIVTDTCSNIRRVLEIVRNFDVPGEQQEIVVFQLKYAQASDLSQEILQMLEKQAPASPAGGGSTGHSAPAPVSAASAGGSSSKGGATIIPETRTNSLIVVASSELMDSIQELIEQLDTARSLDTGNIHVVYLENAEAKDMAKSLQTALQNTATQKGAAAKAESVNIQADEDTNALIIVASPEDYPVVAGVIKQLDIEREEVLVELRIVEVSDELVRNIGVEWSTFDAASASGITEFAGTTYGLASELAAGTLNGASVGAFKQVNGTTKVGALLNLLDQRTGVNIVSTPTIVTANHHKAKITVGENIPYIQQSAVTYQTSTNPQQVNTYAYEDVGVTLEMTPHISHGGLVRMEIDMTYTQVITGAAGTSVNTPTTSKRAETTVVTIQNGATVVIGGLISDQKTNVVQQVPLLGDIPLIGFLFQNTTMDHQKDDLLLFITPHVLTRHEAAVAGPVGKVPAPGTLTAGRN
jgi:general secretion pathway protein D